MRPIFKGLWPTTAVRGSRVVFNKWTKASPYLKARTGKYCHFCEMRVSTSIAIEHIFPQEHYPKLKSNWSNFLLICDYCNSEKLAKIPTAPYKMKYYWPHLHNTLLVFEYPVASLAIPQPNLTYLTNANQIDRAKKLINLYHLDKTVTSTGDPDSRHIERLETLKMAIDRMLEYSRGLATVAAIVDMARKTGFFSIWLTIFDSIIPVKQALINCADFHLAGTGIFDVNLNLIPRNPLNITDSI